MYEAFYGFKEKPFNLTPDPDFLYLSPNHKKVLSYLTYGLETGEGFVQVTGEIGSGKTILIRNLMRRLHPSLKVAHVVNPRGTFRQLMRLILDDLGVAPVEEDLPRERLLAAFTEFVHEQARRNLSVVIIFDEAQNLDPVALEEIRMLSNIETDKKKLVQIIFAGQPQLAELLRSPELEQLAQRIALKCHLDALSLDETKKYIQHRLAVAARGEAPVRFSGDAYEIVYAYSRGVPRKINIVCNAALLAGFIDQRKSFDARYVREAITDLDSSTELDANIGELERPQEDSAAVGAAERRGGRARKGVLIGALVVAVGLGSWLAYKLIF